MQTPHDYGSLKSKDLSNSCLIDSFNLQFKRIEKGKIFAGQQMESYELNL